MLTNIVIVIIGLWFISGLAFFVKKFLEFRDIDPKEYDANTVDLTLGLAYAATFAPLVVAFVLISWPVYAIIRWLKKHK